MRSDHEHKDLVFDNIICVCAAVGVQDLDIIHSELRAKDIERLEGELYERVGGEQA